MPELRLQAMMAFLRLAIPKNESLKG